MTAPQRRAAPRGWLADQLRALLTGLTFLTRIPGPAWVSHEADDLARSTVHFPLIGLLVGLFGGGIYWLAATWWPPLVAAALATAATAWLTGAFHEDALADAFDGFGGGWSRDQILAIMKDSRVGSYGVIAVALVLAAKLGVLASLSAADAVRALVAGHVLGRWSSLPLIWRYPYVRGTSGVGRPFAAGVTGARLALGTAVAVVIVGGTLGVRALAPLAAAVVVVRAAGTYFRRRIGGITGDCLGATNQLVELATYLALGFRLQG